MNNNDLYNLIKWADLEQYNDMIAIQETARKVETAFSNGQFNSMSRYEHNLEKLKAEEINLEAAAESLRELKALRRACANIRMGDPVLSIIVPVYNAEATIEATLDSIQEQTLRDFEVIICNDGSTDKSAEIISDYITTKRRRDDIRWGYINHGDIGQARTVNDGLYRARGLYVAELDSDDRADPRMYKTLIDAAIEFDADVVKCNTLELMPGGKQELRRHITDRIQPRKVYNFREISDRKTQRDAIVRYNNLMSGIARRAFIMENGIRYRHGHNFEDTAVCFKIRALAERYVFIDEYLYSYNRDNPQSGSNTIRDRDAIIDQCHEIYRFCEDNNLEDFIELAALEEFYNYKWNIARMSKDLASVEVFTEKAGKELLQHEIDPDLFPSPIDLEFYNFLRKNAKNESF